MRRNRALRQLILPPLALALGLIAIAGCDEGTPGAAPGVTATPGAGAIPVEDVLRNPAGFTGRSMQVVGMVDQVMAPFAFILTARGGGTGTTSPTMPEPTTTEPATGTASASPTFTTFSGTTGTPTATAPDGSTPITTGTAGATRLVVVHRPGGAIADGSVVTVTGTLRSGFDVRAIETALRIDIDESAFQGISPEFYLEAEGFGDSLTPTRSP